MFTYTPTSTSKITSNHSSSYTSTFTPSPIQKYAPTYTTFNPLRYKSLSSSSLPIQKYDEKLKDFTPINAISVLDKLCAKHGTDYATLCTDLLNLFRIPIPTSANETPELSNIGTIKFICNFYDPKKKYTERSLVETFAQNMYIRKTLLNHHKSLRGEHLTTSTKENYILSVMNATHYYHATFQENAISIFTNGLVFKDQRAKSGISNYSAINTSAAETYINWSHGYSFITDSLREAQGYAENIEKKAGKKAVILDVFADAHSVVPRFEIDPDSGGLKSTMPITCIGYNATLNNDALNFFKSVLLTKNTPFPDITENDILAVYKTLR